MQSHIPELETLSTQSADDELSLLDLLLVLAQNLRLLVFGSLSCGLIALAAASAWPKSYEASAVINAEQTLVTLIKSPVVMGAVLAPDTLQSPGPAFEEAREKLLKRVQASFSAKDKTVTLTVRESSPEKAEQLARSLLSHAFAQSRPRGSERERLERQLNQARERQKEVSANAMLLSKRLASAQPGSRETAQGYAQLMETLEGGDKLIADFEQQLAGIDESRLLQEPVARQRPVGPRVGLIAALGTLAGGFALLFFVFMRQAWANAERSAEGAHKLASIRRALKGN